MAEKAGTPRPHLRAVGDREPDSAAPGEHSLHALIYSKPGHLVRRLQQFAGAIFLEETEAFGITPVQYAILAGVLSHPGVDQVGLARLIGFDRTTIGGVIDRLERKGLVERRLSPGDRRIRLLYPTLGGVDLLAAMYPATERAQRRLLQPLSDEEGEVFKALMGRIVSHHNADTRAPIDRERVRGPASEAGED